LGSEARAANESAGITAAGLDMAEFNVRTDTTLGASD